MFESADSIQKKTSKYIFDTLFPDEARTIDTDNLIPEIDMTLYAIVTIRLAFLKVLSKLITNEWPINFNNNGAELLQWKSNKYFMNAVYVLVLTHFYQSAKLYSFGYDDGTSGTFQSPALLRATIWLRLICTCLYVWEKVEYRIES